MIISELLLTISLHLPLLFLITHHHIHPLFPSLTTSQAVQGKVMFFTGSVILFGEEGRGGRVCPVQVLLSCPGQAWGGGREHPLQRVGYVLSLSRSCPGNKTKGTLTLPVRSDLGMRIGEEGEGEGRMGTPPPPPPPTSSFTLVRVPSLATPPSLPQGDPAFPLPVSFPAKSGLAW